MGRQRLFFRPAKAYSCAKWHFSANIVHVSTDGRTKLSYQGFLRGYGGDVKLRRIPLTEHSGIRVVWRLYSEAWQLIEFFL